MSTYNEQMQRFANRYMAETGLPEITPSDDDSLSPRFKLTHYLTVRLR